MRPTIRLTVACALILLPLANLGCWRNSAQETAGTGGDGWGGAGTASEGGGLEPNGSRPLAGNDDSKPTPSVTQ